MPILQYIWLILVVYFSSAQNINVTVNTGSPVRALPDAQRFLSVTLDLWMYEFPNINGLNYTFILPLAKALGPSYMRFGGTQADSTYFTLNASLGENKREKIIITNFTDTQLDELYNFVKSAGWRLIFDLNLNIRTNKSLTGQWNSSNAQALINYASQRNYTMDFELGNEPEYFPNNWGYNITGAQIAQAYSELRNLLNSNGLYNSSKVMGPSVSTYPYAYSPVETQIVQDFLANGGGSAISVFSFHHYYVNSANATLAQFLNVTILDSYLSVMNSVINTTKLSGYTGPIWLGETSNSYGGGSANLSESYAAGFLWLDKLGLSAKYGIDVVFRQDIFGGYYGILNNTMYPNPDYWLSFLHKRLVGTTVYNVSISPTNSYLRIYAASNANGNSVVVYGQWMSNQSFTIDFPDFTNKQVTAYVVKEGVPGNLYAKSSRINGDLIEWITHQPGPNIRENVTNLPLSLPEYSQFFIVLNQTAVTQCPSGWYRENSTSNKCIKIVKQAAPFFAARFGCSILGPNSSILSINNSFENTEVLQQFNASGCDRFYIGLTRNGSGWTWTNGDSSTYVNWKSAYPTTDNTQNCVTFDSALGTWINRDCDSSFCYVCQMLV